MLDAVFLASELNRCAPEVGSRTLAAVIRVESGGHPWVINSNTQKRSWRFDSKEAAESAARQLIARGDSIDIGLAQINSRNLRGLGLGVSQIFDICTNIKAGAQILGGCYASATRKANVAPGQQALLHALSCYNTGSLWAGRSYVNRVVAAAAVPGDTVAVLRGANAKSGTAAARAPSGLGKPIPSRFMGSRDAALAAYSAPLSLPDSR